MVDSQTYLSTLRNLVEEGHDVSLLITGSSMAPFLIHMRDFIYFGRPERELKKGDMVFYRRENGDYVMHRICNINSRGFYLVGDAQTIVEGPIKREQIFGLVKKVCRKGRWLEPKDWYWKFFAGFWLWILPWRRIIMRVFKFMYFMFKWSLLHQSGLQ